MMVSRVVDAVRASLNSEGYSTLSNAELAARTGVSIATARRALKRAIQEGMLFSHGPNQTRRLSLVANPRTDRTRLALQIVEDAWRFGAAGYRKSQATVAEMLGVSIEVAREAFEVAIERGWLKRETERFEGADGSPRRAYLHQVTEAGKEAIGIARKTALSASTSALSAEKEARAKAEEQLTQAADGALILDLLEENARLKRQLKALETELIQARGELAKIEIGECEACQEREPSNLENAYIVERHLTNLLLERPGITREELDDVMRDRIKDHSLIPYWANRFEQLSGFQFGEDQEEESDEEPRSWLLPLPELKMNPFPYYRGDLN